MKLIYYKEKTKEVVIVTKNKRRGVWEASLHTEKKEKIFNFETIAEIKTKLEASGYKILSISYDAPDKNCFDKNKFANRKKV